MICESYYITIFHLVGVAWKTLENEIKENADLFQDLWAMEKLLSSIQ